MLTILTKLRIPDTINADAETERCIFKTLKFRNRSVLFLPLTFQGGGHENRILLFIFSFKKCLPIRFMGFESAHILTSILLSPLESVVFFSLPHTLLFKGFKWSPRNMDLQRGGIWNVNCQLWQNIWKLIKTYLGCRVVEKCACE